MINGYLRLTQPHYSRMALVTGYLPSHCQENNMGSNPVQCPPSFSPPLSLLSRSDGRLGKAMENFL